MANLNESKLSLDSGTQRDNLSRGHSYSRPPLGMQARGRSKSICEGGSSLRDFLNEAETKIINLKRAQQDLTNEIMTAKSEHQSILLTIDMEYDAIQKMIDQKKAQLHYSLNNSFETYIDSVTILSDKLDSQMSLLENSIQTTKAPANTVGLNPLEIEDKMAEIKSGLGDSINETDNFSDELIEIKSQRPHLFYQSQTNSLKEIIDNIGWIEQELKSYSVRNVLDSPVNPDKPKEVIPFSPIAVATDPGGAVYVLDDEKEGGTLHVIVDNIWTKITHLLKETRVKKQPYSLCVTRDTIYVSYPDADVIAAIWKKHNEQTRIINNQSFSELKPGIKSPHGLSTLDKDSVMIADTGNNRLVVINRLHQVSQVITGSSHAPLHQPTSIGCNDGLVAVLHGGACSVHVYKLSTGELKWRTCSFEINTTSGVQPWVPIRISLHRTGHFKEPEVFMTACYQNNQCILRYNIQKGWLCRMGKSGKKFGQFKDLKAIEFCAEKKEILVCDNGNKRIQIFDY